MILKEFVLDREKGPLRFRVLWTSLGHVPPQGMSKPAEILRRENSISVKLRRISETKIVEANIEEGTPQTKQRMLKIGDQKLTLEQPEIDLLRQKIETYPYWNPLAEESSIDVYDWLNSGKENNNS